MPITQTLETEMGGSGQKVKVKVFLGNKSSRSSWDTWDLSQKKKKRVAWKQGLTLKRTMRWKVLLNKTLLQLWPEINGIKETRSSIV